MRNHEDVQLPGPPRARQAIGALLMIVGGLVLLGYVPFGMMTFGVVVILLGAGLVV